MQIQNTSITNTLNRTVQLGLFDDTSELDRHGLLVSGPIYEGSPHRYGCWSCFSNRLWRHLIALGNTRGPSVVLPICGSCYSRRERLFPAEKLLFDHCVREKAVRHLGEVLACRA